MRKILNIILISLIGLFLSACDSEVKIYDSDLVDSNTITRHYRIEQNSDKCSDDKNSSAIYAFANFKSEKGYVHLVNPAKLLINGEEAKTNKMFDVRNNGMTYPNGLIPSYSQKFQCVQNEAVFEYIRQDEKTITTKIDLRKAILKLSPNLIIDSNQELEIEYENPSNSEISEIKIGVLDETDTRNMQYGSSQPQSKNEKPVIYPEIKKLIIPKTVWEKAKRGKNNLLIRFDTKMPLPDGEKGDINYKYYEKFEIEIK